MEEKFIVRHYSEISQIWAKITQWLCLNQPRFDLLHSFYLKAKEDWEKKIQYKL